MRVITGSASHQLLQQWHRRNPASVGSLFSPPRKPTLKHDLWYAGDNYRFVCWAKGLAWDEYAFKKHLDYLCEGDQRPAWVLAPDLPTDRLRTLEDWATWEPYLRQYCVPIAFAIQDDMTSADIPQSADVLFVGGSDDWRYPLLPQIVGDWAKGRPVHVGRVNTHKRIWQCYRSGASSVDGNGWFRGDPAQLSALIDFLEVVHGGKLPAVKQLEFSYG